ncbi:hypothetical protein PG994_012453 [Apiospora phragmitis]|uniref:Uncharacterized protein n=1 Tax=Apiospora phragmitis TaxID=2905665 RepID=A0ABR1TW01_9PEZI
MVSLLVQHFPHIEEIEFDDVGLRGSNLQSGGIDQVLDAFLRLHSYLESIPSLKKITVWVKPCDRWRRHFDAYWDDELRPTAAISKAGWVLEGRDHPETTAPEPSAPSSPSSWRAVGSFHQYHEGHNDREDYRRENHRRKKKCGCDGFTR